MRTNIEVITVRSLVHWVGTGTNCSSVMINDGDSYT